jgi:riboflavin kinase / FMN adenylyltransferase
MTDSYAGQTGRLDGLVVHGDHRGRELGFPTANIDFEPGAAVPADGVYAGRVVLIDGPGRDRADVHLGHAAISVGTNPTFDGRERRVEAHILDFAGDLYGQRIGIEFTRRLRGMLRFGSVEALTEQMRRDVAQARAILALSPLSAEQGLGQRSHRLLLLK